MPRSTSSLAAVFAAVLALAAACSPTIPEGQLICDEPAQCPDGWFCIDGRCHSRPDAPDGGSTDGFVPREDGGIGIDTKGIDAGCDRDLDGFCPPEDCEDTDPSTRPGADEACVGRGDEDCDGYVDEGCPWFFGTPHPVTRATGEGGILSCPRISDDGLRLYFLEGNAGATLHVVSRPSVDQPFEAQTEVPADLSSIVGNAYDISSDERELIVMSMSVLHRATRLSRGAVFSELVPMPALDNPDATGSTTHPYLAGEGRELLFGWIGGPSPGIRRATRSSTTSPFTAPSTAVAVDGITLPIEGPWLSRDGLMLLVTTGGTVPMAGRDIYLTRRDTRETASFTSFGPEDALNSSHWDAHPHVHEDTGELYFSSSRPWSAAATGVWRARVCRDGPCVDPRVDCDEGVRSPDGLHCYWLESTARSWADAQAACEEGGANLATVSSSAEADLVSALSTGVLAWLGAFDDRDGVAECHLSVGPCRFGWVTGEPFRFARWATGDPDEQTSGPSGGEDCLLADEDGDWRDDDCVRTRASLCERELWPTF